MIPAPPERFILPDFRAAKEVSQAILRPVFNDDFSTRFEWGGYRVGNDWKVFCRGFDPAGEDGFTTKTILVVLDARLGTFRRLRVLGREPLPPMRRYPPDVSLPTGRKPISLRLMQTLMVISDSVHPRTVRQATRSITFLGMTQHWTVVLEPDEEGGFTASIAEFPGAIAWAASREEARADVLVVLAELQESYREIRLKSAARDAELVLAQVSDGWRGTPRSSMIGRAAFRLCSG